MRMEILQEKIKKIQEQKQETIQEVALALDVPTRWNSIITMLDSLSKTKEALQALAPIYEPVPVPTETEFKVLDDLTAALRPLEILTCTICSANFNVLEADVSFKTAFRALQAQNTHVADRILSALQLRYQQRKNVALLSALKFLFNPVGYQPGEDGTLQMDELKCTMRDQYLRLFPDEVLDESTSVPASSSYLRDDEESDQDLIPTTGTYAEKLAAQFKADLESLKIKPKVSEGNQVCNGLNQHSFCF